MSPQPEYPRRVGVCCICGKTAELTFEHVPPKSAFNGREVFEQTLSDQLKGLPPELVPGTGEYSLCGDCNEKLGSRYGTVFVDFCRDARIVLENADEYCRALPLPETYPLRVLKQILVMFATLCGPGLLGNDDCLRRFVRRRDEQALPAHVRVYISYALPGGVFRRSGVSARGSMVGGSPVRFSELVYPPFAYVLSLESGPPDERLVEIGTIFKSYAFKDKVAINLPLPQLPTSTHLPGDYRSRTETEENLRRQGIDPDTYRDPFSP